MKQHKIPKPRYVFYINVGNMAPTKAEEYLKTLKKKAKSFFGDRKVLYISVRDDKTRIETLYD